MGLKFNNTLFKNVETIKMNKYKTYEDKFFCEIKYNIRNKSETIKCYINQSCFDIIINNSNSDMYITGDNIAIPETIVKPSTIIKTSIAGEEMDLRIPPMEQQLLIPYCIIEKVSLRD